MRISFVIRKETESTGIVHYGDEGGASNPIFAQGITLQASAFPVPAPELIEVTLEWREPAKAARSASGAGLPAPGPLLGSLRQMVKPGAHVRIVKSRVSGPQSPPEWLGQYVGKTGVVLWASTDGTMLEVEGATVWFSYHELELID